MMSDFAPEVVNIPKVAPTPKMGISITKRDKREFFFHFYRKSGLLSKNMMSDFAPEVAKYLKIILPQQQFRECANLLFCSVSDAACLFQ